MHRGRSLIGRGTVFVVSMFLCVAFSGAAIWQPRLTRLSGAGNGSPGQTGEVQLTYQDYTNLIAGKKITDDILAKSVNPQGWLEYSEDMDTDLAAVRTEKA